MASDSRKPKNLNYQERAYWEERFQNETSYDWCCKLTDFVHILEGILPCESKILILGCGNSPMGAELYQKGYQNITSIDYSENVIQRMKEEYKNCKGMSWYTMDMFCLSFPEQSFDCVIEKATFEVLFVAEKDPWKVTESTYNKFQLVLQQIDRVLKPGGQLISISFTQPHFRQPLLKKALANYSCSYQTFGSVFHFFMYISKKPVVEETS